MAEWLRRYVQVVVNIVGVGSSPTECIFHYNETYRIRLTLNLNAVTFVWVFRKRLTRDLNPVPYVKKFQGISVRNGPPPQY